MNITSFLLLKKLDKKTFLLINTLSGAVDLIGKEYAELLTNSQKKKSLPQKIKNELKERGYFITKKKEMEILRRIEKLTSTPKDAPPDFFLCYTYSCNLRCIYCNEKHLRENNKKLKTMDPAQLNAAFGAMLKLRNSLKKNSKCVITLFGGEPLLLINKKSILKTLKFAKENDFKIRIVSNGVLAEKFKDALLNYRDVIEIIAISLDGPRSVNDRRRKSLHGSSFDQIVKSINFLLSKNLPVEVRPIVDRDNVDFLPKLAKFIIEQKWTMHKSFSAAIAKTMFPIETAGSKYKYTLSSSEFLEQLHILTDKHPEMNVFGDKWLGDFEPFGYLRKILEEEEIATPKLSGCRAVNPGMYIFGPDNLIYPCLELVGIAKHATGKFYPYLQESEKRKWWKEFRILQWSSKCGKCNLVTLCGGGCPLKYFVSQVRNREEKGCSEIKKNLNTYIEINRNRFLSLA
jgi:uncharacterized protein